MKMKTKVKEWNSLGMVKVERFMPNLYSPVYIYDFRIVAELETPPLNGLRRLLRLESAEPHTVLVFDESFKGMMNSRKTDYADFGPHSDAIEVLESKGYEVYRSVEDFMENYSKDDDCVTRKGERMIEEYERKQERIERSYEQVERRKEYTPDEQQIPCDECPGFEFSDMQGGQHTRDCSNHWSNNH